MRPRRSRTTGGRSLSQLPPRVTASAKKKLDEEAAAAAAAAAAVAEKAAAAAKSGLSKFLAATKKISAANAFDEAGRDQAAKKQTAEAEGGLEATPSKARRLRSIESKE